MRIRHVVLIVDDDFGELEELGELLKCERIEVLSANSEAEAHSIFLKTKDLHVVLLDINMPEIGGLALLDKIRESGARGAAATVIMMTGSPDVHSVVDALNLGASALLLKPIDPQDLVSTVSKALEIHRKN